MPERKVALITGATSGIGRGAALAMSAAGWRVVVSGTDADAGAAVVAELGPAGGRFVAADLGVVGASADLVADVIAHDGGLNAVVYSAGIHSLGSIEDQPASELDRLWQVNVRGAYETAAAAIPAFRSAGGGVFVAVSSEAGIVAVPHQAAYNMTKAALIMLARNIAVDHAADGIRAISICPGTTRTPLVERAIASAPDPAAHEQMLAGSRPAGRLGTVAEIAAAIEFVTRDDVAFLTGTELVIDGGFTAR